MNEESVEEEHCGEVMTAAPEEGGETHEAPVPLCAGCCGVFFPPSSLCCRKGDH